MIALASAAVFAAAVCPVTRPVPGEAGQSQVARVPLPAAVALNNEGKSLYKEGRWDEARVKYRAALGADPEFLAPALNIACSFARQERFAEAAHEASALVARSYAPWAREVLEAADLATLHVRPEMAELRNALSQAAAAWGRALLTDTLLFVARTRPAIRTRGEGVLVLGLNQEIFAWSPTTGRYRQVTADDGRVIAFVRSDDGRTITYLRAGKLVRAPGAPPRLRGISIRQLDLPSMALGPVVELPGGDWETLSLWATKGTFAELRATRRGEKPTSYRVVGGALVPLSSPSPETHARRAVTVTGHGVQDRFTTAGSPSCPFTASDERKRDAAPAVGIRSARATFTLNAEAAGLFGLPFGDDK